MVGQDKMLHGRPEGQPGPWWRQLARAFASSVAAICICAVAVDLLGGPVLEAAGRVGVVERGNCCVAAPRGSLGRDKRCHGCRSPRRRP